MSEAYYKEALKLGQKEYRAREQQGLSPFLPAMDDIVPAERSAGGVELGVVQIPAELIVGTRSQGRVGTFAANFMPIADPKTEFAVKWQRLCTAHLREGIRDPILAFEYLNRFYVAEGNKRVSVLKFFDAPQITGEVVRILPERNEDTAIYFEFVDFYRLSRMNNIEVSRPGGYAALQRLVGKAPDEPWTEEDRRRFLADWFYFRQAYESLGGKKLRSTVGDAMLAYMEIYGYPSIRGRTAYQIRSSLAGVWEEIALQQEEELIDVKLTPTEKKPSIVQKVLSGEPSRTRVAFVHDGNPESSAWTRGHERGREYVQRVLADRICTTAYFDAFTREPESIIEQAIAEGNSVVFTTSPRLLTASLRAAVNHPEATVFNCSLNMSHRYIRTYYARMYEVRFITGAIAGSLAGDEPIGYLADYPIFGQIAGVNAFALGAQMTNPRTKVFLEWSAVGGADAALERFAEQGIRLISSQDLVRAGRTNTSLGLSIVDGGDRVNLATPLWQWGSYYEQLLRQLRDRSLQSEYSGSRRALNYYWGISAGVAELRLSDRLPPSARKMAELLTNSICAGLCEPFRGPLYSQEGKVLEEGETLTAEQIIRMDWLAENVAGRIPSYDELTELGKATVDAMGVSAVYGDRRG